MKKKKKKTSDYQSSLKAINTKNNPYRKENKKIKI
jgi:hypothetical protein